MIFVALMPKPTSFWRLRRVINVFHLVHKLYKQAEYVIPQYESRETSMVSLNQFEELLSDLKKKNKLLAQTKRLSVIFLDAIDQVNFDIRVRISSNGKAELLNIINNFNLKLIDNSDEFKELCDRLTRYTNWVLNNSTGHIEKLEVMLKSY